MAVLKKVKASTLMETLVASVLIVVIFMVASLILNNLFSNSIKFNTQKIENELNAIEYAVITKQLKLPYRDDYENWQISSSESKANGMNIVLLEAKNKNNGKFIKKTIVIEGEK
ncbi:hypothetical protein [Abyssalbus ytuae]|uniref:Uncharacterized protein n=1 Tax=Abyssalbus ytuae TaxID=2926907 RepID=A0A9E6ZS85_9FLAO|nr:hypothetical protein [Abyssalbus ytuae]UOB17898.1 hypothetical protein MQE35_01045 [Abyssalbus ytuae]